MPKVAINRCFGGFALSERACAFLGIPERDAYKYMFSDEAARTEQDLIRCIETLGSEVNSDDASSDIVIVEVPDDVEWYIEEHDGCEHIAECHRTWC